MIKTNYRILYEFKKHSDTYEQECIRDHHPTNETLNFTGKKNVFISDAMALSLIFF